MNLCQLLKLYVPNNKLHNDYKQWTWKDDTHTIFGAEEKSFLWSYLQAGSGQNVPETKPGFSDTFTSHNLYIILILWGKAL
jgi:hypothetical protein